MPCRPRFSKRIGGVRNSHHRLAEASAGFRQTRFRFPQAARCLFRGQLLLARLPAARDETPEQRGVLAKEIYSEQGSRPARNPNASQARLASVSDLGARACPKERGAVVAPDSPGAAMRRCRPERAWRFFGNVNPGCRSVLAHGRLSLCHGLLCAALAALQHQ